MIRFGPEGSERARVIGEGLWVATGQALLLLGRLVGVRLITDWVSPAVYGHVALLSALTALAMSLLVAPVVQAAIRFFPDAVRDGHPSMHRTLTSRYLRWAALASAGAILGGGVLWSVTSHGGPTVWAYLFLAAGFLAESSRTYETGLLNAARRQAESSLWLGVDAWLRPLAALGFLLVGGSTAAVVLAGYALGSFATNLAFMGHRVFPRAGDPESIAAWEARATALYRGYALPLVPVALLGWAFNLGDRYVLAAAAGVEVTGLYAAAYGLASVPFLALSGVFVSTLRPVLFEAVVAGDRPKERRVLAGWIATTCAVGAGGVVLLAELGPWLVRIALGPEFRVSAPLLPWIGAAYAIQALQNVFETRMYARKRTEMFLVLQVVSTGVAMPLYLILIPSLGAMGAALGTLGGMVASCLTSVLLARLPEKGARPEATR